MPSNEASRTLKTALNGHKRLTARWMAVAVAITGFAAVVLPSETAFAALPTCNGVTTKVFGAWEADVPTFGGSTNCTLSRNSAFAAPTRVLQHALNDCNNHAGLLVDGIYGNNTYLAVRAVQVAPGIDGIYGPVTGRGMLWPSYTFPRIRCLHAV